MYLKSIITALLLYVYIVTTQAQTTLGLIEHNYNIAEGYTILYPSKDNRTYLLNECGEVVHQWTTKHLNGVSYLLNDGSLLKSGQHFLEKYDWNNNLLWSVDLNLYNLSQHHDICPLPNGNILFLFRDAISITSLIERGRNPSITSSDFDLSLIHI